MMGYGGRRKGAGRKPNLITKKGASRVLEIAARTLPSKFKKGLGESDEVRCWLWLLESSVRRHDLSQFRQVMEYLTNRRDGMPAQSVQVEGGAPIGIVLGMASGPNGRGAGQAGSGS